MPLAGQSQNGAGYKGFSAAETACFLHVRPICSAAVLHSERSLAMTRLLALASSICLLLAGVVGLPQARAAGMQPACAGEALCQQRFVEIGGIEQWISIAGENPANP